MTDHNDGVRAPVDDRENGRELVMQCCVVIGAIDSWQCHRMRAMAEPFQVRAHWRPYRAPQPQSRDKDDVHVLKSKWFAGSLHGRGRCR